MLYLSQVTVYSALLYAIYHVMLRERASHGLSRAYLLLCAALPLIIPFIHLPAFSGGMDPGSAIAKILLPDVTVLSKHHTVNGTAWNIWDIAAAIYLLIALALLSRVILEYISFKRFVKKHERATINGIKVLLNTRTGPGSFQNYIFLPGATIDPVIYDHELAHIRLKHSADILFMRLSRACFWPNVALHFINKELKIVHEFQADARSVVIKRTISPRYSMTPSIQTASRYHIPSFIIL